MSAIETIHPARSLDMPYERVNAAISDILFDGRFSDKPLYLATEGDWVTDAAGELGIPADAFTEVLVNSVVATLDWTTSSPFLSHMRGNRLWTRRGRVSNPPFTALLLVLSHAAERMHRGDDYSSTNYYQRLFEVLRVFRAERQSALRTAFQETEELWTEFNQWLSSADDNLGLPTARPVNNHRYVGHPMSQAMVTEEDRNRMRLLFAGLPEMPESQVALLPHLQEWMRGSVPTRTMKGKWENKGLRDHICSVAWAELQSWEGVAEVRDSTGRRRLVWAADVQTVPRFSLNMFLTASGNQPADTLRLSDVSDSTARAAYKKELFFENLEGTDYSFLGPIANIDLDAALQASACIETSNGDNRWYRPARPIIPMVRAEDTMLYREVPKVSLLSPHVILCRKEWKSTVQGGLIQCARPGFRAIDGKEGTGIPVGWTIFTGVEIVRVLENVKNDIQCLVPSASEMTVEISGGLRIGAGVWHRRFLPRISAIADHGSVELRLEDMSGRRVAFSEAVDDECFLDIKGDSTIEEGEYTLVACKSGEVKQRRKITFATSEVPRADAVRHPGFGYRPDLSKGAVSASRDGEGPVVQGMSISGIPIARLARAVEYRPIGSSVDAIQERRIPQSRGRSGSPDDKPTQQCLSAGYHHWKCDEFGDGKSRTAATRMACIYCSEEFTMVRVKPKPGKSGKAAGKASPAGTRPSIPRMPSFAEEANGTAGFMDEVFDAICHVGNGAWRRLTEIVDLATGMPKDSMRFVGALTACGHVDLGFDKSGRHPSEWAVAPPTLTYMDGRRAFLAGFRSKSLVAEITARLEKAGAVTGTKAQMYAPSVVMFKGVEPAAAREALDGLSDPCGRPVQVSEGFAATVAGTVPTTTELVACMPEINLGKLREPERFDLVTARWKQADDCDAPGAYRAFANGRIYFVRDTDGLVRQVPFASAKTAAALAAGARLHEYDETSENFHEVPGCESPALLARALVSASGFAPVRSGGRMVYRNIDARLAQAAMSKLYN